MVVYVGNIEYAITDNYALQLHCTRAGGWILYKFWEGKWEVLGEEYGEDEMCIAVAGRVILGKIPKNPVKPPRFGWGGKVENGQLA